MSRHRGAPVRPRYGRLTALGSSLSVTLIAVLGGTGVLPSAVGGGSRDADPAASLEKVAAPAGSAAAPAGPEPSGSRKHDRAADGLAESAGATLALVQDGLAEDLETALPADSGSGKRVVFSQGRQRVWLVTGAKHVERTYLVSGSVYDNLDPGTYAVYSRSEQAWGIDDSGTMRYFVRFAQGDNASIGFHDIPVDDGEPVQTVAELGTPLSHGCIRQRRRDAVALWKFAPLGTTVVVTA